MSATPRRKAPTGPRSPRWSSVWTARSAASARSGGRPRRRPGGTLPCGSCTRPPRPGVTAGRTRPRRNRRTRKRIVAQAYTVARHTEPGVRSVTEVVAGDATKVLLTAAAEGQLVVLGKSTTGAADEWMLAPVAVRVAARSPRPVVLVPRPRGATAADRPVAAVLGVGEPGDDERVAEFAAEAARRAGSALSVLQIRRPHAPGARRLDAARIGVGRALPGPRGAPHRTARRDGRPGARGDLPGSADRAQRRARLPAAPRSRRPAPLAAAALHLAHGARAAGAPPRARSARGDHRARLTRIPSARSGGVQESHSHPPALSQREGRQWSPRRGRTAARREDTSSERPRTRPGRTGHRARARPR